MPMCVCVHARAHHEPKNEELGGKHSIYIASLKSISYLILCMSCMIFLLLMFNSIRPYSVWPLRCLQSLWICLQRTLYSDSKKPTHWSMVFLRRW